MVMATFEGKKKYIKSYRYLSINKYLKHEIIVILLLMPTTLRVKNRTNYRNDKS